ncbi:Glycosyltransferase family 10 (fucosyltransferase) C-term [Gemmobacter aquatilis]|uniref:Glycosyltransferase family 10 (Fucosyltransferase) C-term n=1 Tax=Gemmobacter aquatilis TaxID=933059 RepID=A0A1H8N2Y9_9RHOB|nr:glycosyltransferase family 10 [Gemmobacter aquatilis]SEO24005.1 Glycosyltransferase family 10 (fucosyltransferase) C-term [Gemmobacter aquatilis]
MIRVLTFGAFRNRQPLAYAPIRDRLAGRLRLVDDPTEAQIVTISHHKDLELFGNRLWQMLAARPGLRLVLLSEEPFWDSCWAPDPFARHQVFATASGPLPYAVLNHQNSAIFQAAQVPYFLLTHPRYIAHYQPRLDRNAGRSATDWLAQFRDAEWDAGFMGEKRTHERHRPAWPAEDLWGLSVYRSRFTQLCTGTRVLRLGKGWSDGPPRQALPDWHQDKLERFDLRCRYLGAFENTHQREYVSEKIYDAFATGAIPLYFAGPGHAVHRLIRPGGWRNFHAVPPRPDAFDARRPVSLAEAEAYAATQQHLAGLFATPRPAEAELERVAAALTREFAALLS